MTSATSIVDPAVPTDSLYAVIHRRRDVRGEFTGADADPETLQRILAAGHAAPSVGMTQPWDFVVVRSGQTRRRFEEHVRTERDTFAATLTGERAATFSRITIDGILESALSVVVTHDQSRGGPAVLGRHAIADAGLYSTEQVPDLERAGWRQRRPLHEAVHDERWRPHETP